MGYGSNVGPLDQGARETDGGAPGAITVAYDPDATGKLRRALLHALESGVREIVLVVRPSGTIAADDLELIEAVGSALADRGGALLTITGEAGDAESFLVRERRGERRVADEMLELGAVEREGSR